MQADDLSTFHWHNLLDLMWKCIHVASLASISYFVLASPSTLNVTVVITTLTSAIRKLSKIRMTPPKLEHCPTS